VKLRSRVFTSRGWLAEDGDPSRPQAVLGVPVTERLATRRDAPGALVRLADDRYALTGVVLAVGTRRQLDRYLRRRAHDADRAAWYAEARRLLDSGRSEDRQAQLARGRG
jgi:cell volume regulation protein A